ncbi:hypothetical protein [Chthonobacter rhizosphaerae]|uniref:hypothetical protein n=1 Tax=Chthonobacter rhizosphaerae TaxID=2735553 RepID=UPI0015EFB4FC|nr:hypothetical protein [Chthonobacter rhizosphaerae]
MSTQGGRKPPQVPLSGLFGTSINTVPGVPPTPSTELVESIRRRGSWNERFRHWERPESTTETKRIERARNMVQEALANNEWLNREGCRLAQQGSFTNRTNTRGESDIDLRVQHPSLVIRYGDGVNTDLAYNAMAYYDTGRPFQSILAEMRKHIVTDLVGSFGRAAVDDTGKRAIRVNGLEGSRAEVDVVPAFTLHFIRRGFSLMQPYITTEGVGLLNPPADWTFNFPDLHIANGRSKRQRTGLQFKRVVRIIKRMQSDMMAYEATDKRVPSFLIECLVHSVEDGFFNVEDDDRYGRVKRVLERIAYLINGEAHTFRLLEINDVKLLFGSHQGWRLQDAQEFVASALAHLGDA